MDERKWLLDLQVDINHYNIHQDTPLIIAASVLNSSYLKLITGHPDCDINKSNDQGHTALHSCFIGYILSRDQLHRLKQVYRQTLQHKLDDRLSQCVDILLAHADIDVNIPDTSGVTELMLATMINKPLLVKKVMEAGGDVGRLDNIKRSAIQFVDVTDGMKCLKLLLTHGGSRHLNLVCRDGNTFIQRALKFSKCSGIFKDYILNLFRCLAYKSTDDVGDIEIKYQQTIKALVGFEETLKNSKVKEHAAVVVTMLDAIKALLPDKSRMKTDVDQLSDYKRAAGMFRHLNYDSTFLKSLLTGQQEITDSLIKDDLNLPTHPRLQKILDLIYYLIVENCSVKQLRCVSHVESEYNHLDLLTLKKEDRQKLREVLYRSGAEQEENMSTVDFKQEDEAESSDEIFHSRNRENFTSVCFSLSLKEKCVRVIRQQLGVEIHDKVKNLDVLQHLYHDILLSELLPDEHSSHHFPDFDDEIGDYVDLRTECNIPNYNVRMYTLR